MRGGHGPGDPARHSSALRLLDRRRRPARRVLDLGPAIVETEAFEAARAVPAPCLSCDFRATCAGGCAGRRRLLNALDQPDPYCPVVRGDDRRLAVRMAAARELPKLESACTTVVIAR